MFAYRTAALEIRLAMPSDIPDMIEVHRLSWEAAYRGIIPDIYIEEMNTRRPGSFARMVTSENATQHIILKDGRAVGILGIDEPRDEDLDDRFHELQGIYLHPDYYRQGIGSEAMEFAYSLAQNLCKTFMVLWVLAENQAAIGFYVKQGFCADGASRVYSFGNEMKGIRMRKAL